MEETQTRVLSVAKNYLRTPIGEMAYLSNNFSEMLTPAAAGRYVSLTETEMYQRLDTKGIASKAAAVANADFSPALKTLVFNSANSAVLDGKFYMLRDFNSAQSVIEFATNGIVIDAAAEVKNCKFDIKADLRAENAAFPPQRFGSTFPLTVTNLMIPFIVYALENISTSKICFVGGDILRYGEISGDGAGAELHLQDSKVFANDALAAKFLATGLYKVTAFVGVKVATTADSIFTSTFLGKFAVEPRIKSVLAFV